MQVLVRSTTSARPRVASPAAPVNDAGLASPTTAYLRSSCAAPTPGRARSAPARMGTDMRCLRLAKDFRRYRREPGLGIVRLARTELARRVRGTDAAGAFDVRQQSILRLVDA